MKSDKFWYIVLGGVLVISVLAAAFLALRQTDASYIGVYQDGVLIKTISLAEVDEPYSFTVECRDGFNIIEVERGWVRISEADCPDGFCIRQGWINGGAAPIVCLPHQLVIKIERAHSPDVDAVAG